MNHPMPLAVYQKLAALTECPHIKSRLRMFGAFGAASETLETLPNDSERLVPVRLNHAVIGMAGETGELATAIQRWLYYGKELDKTNIKEELGDMLWYIAEACNALKINMDELPRSNIAKLKARFPDKFTEEAAAEENRDREAERRALEAEAAGNHVSRCTFCGNTDTPKDPMMYSSSYSCYAHAQCVRELLSSEGGLKDSVENVDKAEKMADEFGWARNHRT